MLSGSGIVYAPEAFYRRNSLFTATKDGDMIIQSDPRRVMINIFIVNPAVTINPRFWLGQFGVGGSEYFANFNSNFQLTWINDYIMACQEVYCEGFGYPQVFSVTEILYTFANTARSEYDPRKQASYATKISSFIQRRWANSRRTDSCNT